jgi:carotenoid cleavage dioxygenase-like enzyme
MIRLDRILLGSLSGFTVGVSTGTTGLAAGAVGAVVVGADGAVRVSTGASLAGSLLAHAASNTTEIAIMADENFSFIFALLK